MAATLRFGPAALDRMARPSGAAAAFELIVPSPALVQRTERADPATARRAKIRELSTHFHCSIIGTCLSTAELRRILGKVGISCYAQSEHELHGQAVRAEIVRLRAGASATTPI